MSARRLLPAIAAVAALAATAFAAGGERAVSYPFPTMGTTGRVTIVTADSAKTFPLARMAHDTCVRLDSLLTNWTATSEVARINREIDTGAKDIDPEVSFVIAEAMQVGWETERAFDITVEPLVRLWGFLGGKPAVPEPGDVERAFEKVGMLHLFFDGQKRTMGTDTKGVRIDLGGIAKGYAVDAMADSLRSRGVKSALVDLSGNMSAIGAPPGADAWRIGLRDPRDRMPSIGRILLHDGEAIATSAKYEQFVARDGKTYGHIMDPRTGRPAEGLIAVTVVCPRAIDADAWGTALFVLGPAEARLHSQVRSDVDAILVTPGDAGIDTLWVENALKDRFTLEPAAAKLFRVEFF